MTGVRLAAARIHARAVVDPSARLARGCVVAAGAVIGPGVCIGHRCVIGANVTLLNCSLRHDCHIAPGVCIGSDGFGWVPQPAPQLPRRKPQLLRVEIGAHVVIGANSCIDRGSWRNTSIGDGCKIDNLVQIGHNVVMGSGCLIAGQAGIAGSVTLGDAVLVGGQAGIAQHVRVASGVHIAAKSGVMSDLDTPGGYAGVPAQPVRDWHRLTIMQRRALLRVGGG